MNGITSNPCAEIDMSGPRGHLDDPIALELSKIFGVEGVDVIRNGNTAKISFFGWSPTLHRIHVGTTVDAVTGATDEFLFRLHHNMSAQRRRAEEGGRLGFLGPLTDHAVINHLHTDRSLAEMHRSDPTLPPLFQELTKACAALHRVSTYRGTPAFGTRHGSLWETTDGGETVRLIGSRVRFTPDGVRTGPPPGQEIQATFDGIVVEIPTDPLPETMLKTLVGRRVGDLVRLHPEIDERVIRQVVNSDEKQRVIVGVEPDAVKVSDL